MCLLNCVQLGPIALTNPPQALSSSACTASIAELLGTHVLSKSPLGASHPFSALREAVGGGKVGRKGPSHCVSGSGLPAQKWCWFTSDRRFSLTFTRTGPGPLGGTVAIRSHSHNVASTRGQRWQPVTWPLLAAQEDCAVVLPVGFHLKSRFYC